MSQAAGHDINYIELTGALYSIGRHDSTSTPPLNLVGDFEGGGLMLAFGVVCSLYETQNSGKGQVVEAAMVDGAAILVTIFYGMRPSEIWAEDRQDNFLDGRAHFCDKHEINDGKYICVGSIEPHFYKLLLKKTGLEPDPNFSIQMDRENGLYVRPK